MKVLFDNNLAPRLARCLQALMGDEHHIVALRDKFPANIADVDFIRLLHGEGGWVLISADRRITRNKAEKQALRQSNVIGMFMVSGLYNAGVMVQAARLIMLWEEIEMTAATAKGGAMFELPLKSTRLTMIK